MTVAEVKAVIREIRDVRSDDERAHILEDGLYLAVLRAIANGVGDESRELAEAAIEAHGIEFARWCA